MDYNLHSRLTKNEKQTLFEEYLTKAEIHHDVIRPYTPKHNGKVERSHRKDNERFYKKRKFYSLEDARTQIKQYLKEYNNFPITVLNFKTPTQVYNEFVERSTTNEN